MASDTVLLTIYNLALSHIGQKPVDNTTDETQPEILACNTHFPNARDSVLAEVAFPFNDAPIRLQQHLSVDDVSIPGWSYFYTYPASALAVWSVYSSENASKASENDFAVRYLPALSTHIICTNEAYAYANVSYLVTDYTLWDDRFIQAVSYKLASAICMQITGDANLALKFREMYTIMISEAKRKSASEKQKKFTPTNSYKASR
jgi:hypothetical protein